MLQETGPVHDERAKTNDDDVRLSDETVCERYGQESSQTDDDSLQEGKKEERYKCEEKRESIVLA